MDRSSSTTQRISVYSGAAIRGRESRAERQLLRAADALRRGREEAAQQIGDRLDPILARPFRFAFEIVREGDDFARVDLAVVDPDEL
jgi:hypothetical protein